MARAKSELASAVRRDAPALSIDDRFDQLVSMAADLAEERLRDKSASNQLIAELIRYGSVKEKLQREKTLKEIDMLKAKAEALAAQKSSIELYERAMKAFAEYSGHSSGEEEYEDDEDDEEY